MPGSVAGISEGGESASKRRRIALSPPTAYCLLTHREMGFHSDQVLPRLINWGMRSVELQQIRERCLQGVKGEVLEVGFGSGLNLPHYPEEVAKLLAVDPAVVGRKLARKRLAECPFPVEFVGLDGQEIPLPDASVDSAVTTWTLCTIPDPYAALSEIRRVLRPGGKLHFVEHGRAPEAGVRKWQDRWNPVHKVYAGGCNLNRAIGEVVGAGGFRVEKLENFYIKGPRMFTYMYLGSASSAESAAGPEGSGS